jgi:hypothetical protein
MAQPFLTDISDERAPVDRGRLNLAINDPAHCADALASGVNASSHYHDVDNREATTFAMVSMWNAGLRVFDVRDPDKPTEVAYFNPGTFGVPLLDGSGHRSTPRSTSRASVASTRRGATSATCPRPGRSGWRRARAASGCWSSNPGSESSSACPRCRRDRRTGRPRAPHRVSRPRRRSSRALQPSIAPWVASEPDDRAREAGEPVVCTRLPPPFPPGRESGIGAERTPSGVIHSVHPRSSGRAPRSPAGSPPP